MGLGAMGSAAVYQLAKRGTSVIGIDQFRPPHQNGSTHGDTRITRQAAGEGPAYVPLVLRSHQLWREIESETGADLLTACGVLMMRPAAVRAAQHGVNDRLATTIEIARSFGISHETLDAAEVRERYPQFQVEDDAQRVYFEPGGGFVRPEAAVESQLDLADRLGARLHYDEHVISLDQKQNGVELVTTKDRYSAERVVAAVGPWITTVFPDPSLSRLLKVYRQILHWFPMTPGTESSFAATRFPAFVWSFGNGPSDYMYGFPAIDGPSGGVKVATETWGAPSNPDTVNRDVDATEARAMFDHCVSGRIPALTSPPLRSVTCLYTVTPDYGFIIDQHPDKDRIILVSPCSGHGFKHSAAIGEAVSQHVLDGGSAIDLTHFRLDRPSLEVGFS